VNILLVVGVVSMFVVFVYPSEKFALRLSNVFIYYVGPLGLGWSLGAQLLISIDQEVLEKSIGFILLVLLPTIFIKKDIGVKPHKFSKTRKLIGVFILSLVLIWGGFFGGGAGTLIFYVLVLFFGFTFIQANATFKIAWLLLSLTALTVFTINGLVDYISGMVLFAGMFVGGYAGAHVAITKGNAWVKIVFAVVVVAAAIKFIFF